MLTITKWVESDGGYVFFSLSALSNYVKYPTIPGEAYVVVFVLIGVLVVLLKFVEKPEKHQGFFRFSSISSPFLMYRDRSNHRFND